MAGFFIVNGAFMLIFFTWVAGVVIGVAISLLLVPLVVLAVRFARLRVEFTSTEVVAHQLLLTDRIPKTEIAAVSSGRSSNPFGIGHTVHLKLRDGRTIRLDALASLSFGPAPTVSENRRQEVQDLLALRRAANAMPDGQAGREP